MKKAVSSDKTPKAGGPYSAAIVHGGLVYVSGQVPVDPATGDLVEDDIAIQTARVLENVKLVLEAAGSSLEKALKTTVYLADINEFATMNKIYATFFPGVPPARTTIQAARLPRNSKIEVDMIASVD